MQTSLWLQWSSVLSVNCGLVLRLSEVPPHNDLAVSPSAYSSPSLFILLVQDKRKECLSFEMLLTHHAWSLEATIPRLPGKANS